MMRKIFRSDFMGYFGLVLFVLLAYLSIIGLYKHFTQTVLPAGDPFTYTVGFYRLLDISKNNYFLGILAAARDNWYWMLNFPIAVLSPILFKRPYSIAVINYIMYFFASAAFFHLARILGSSRNWAFICALVLWVYPVNYGFDTYSSMPVLSLDSMFNACLYLSIACTLIYLVRLESRWRAVAAGFAAGIAIWGRGNSLLVVGLVLCVPVLAIAYSVWKSKDSDWRKNFYWFIGIVLFMAMIFYGLMGKAILTYYTAQAHFVARHHWTLHSAMPYLRNIPGFFFYRSETSPVTLWIGIFCHLFMLATFIYALIKRNSLSVFLFTGFFIYCLTYIINILLFTDPHMTLLNCLLIYRPMLLGMVVNIVVCIVLLVRKKQINIRTWAVFLFSVVLLGYGYQLTKILTPKPPKANLAVTPVKVEKLTKQLIAMAHGKPISVLWYEHYSPVLFQYYQVQDSLPPMPLYTKGDYNDIWSQWDYSLKNKKRIQQFLSQDFQHAAVIIIPAYYSLYATKIREGEPYAFYRFAKDFVKIFSLPATPRFVVRMVLWEDVKTPLLVLQQARYANGKGIPLKLPYPAQSNGQPFPYKNVPQY